MHSLDRPSLGSTPDVLRALAKDKADDRASALEDISRLWARQHRWYYRNVVEDYAYYYGDHYGYWNEAESIWVSRPKAPRDTVRLVINQTMPTVDQAAALVSQENPQLGATGGTSEGSDRKSAEGADALIEHRWRHFRHSENYVESARSAAICGTDLWHGQWDTTRGRHVTTGLKMTKPPKFTEDGEVESDPEFESETEPEGEAVWEPLFPQNVRYAPTARHPYDGLGVFVVQEMRVADLQEAHPKSKGKGKGDEHKMTVESVEADKDLSDVRRMAQMTNAKRGAGAEDSARESAVCQVFYLRRHEKYPNGYMAIFTQGRMLYEGDNPVYPTQEEKDELDPRICWPVISIRWKPRKNSPWGEGLVRHLVPFQKAINGTVSKAVQHVAMIASAKVILPKKFEGSMTDMVGQVLRVGSSFRAGDIGYLSPPQMPAEYIAIWRELKEDMRNVAGLSAATQGQSKSGDSGYKTDLLQKRDFGRLAPVKAAIDASWGELVRFDLFLFRRHAEHARKLLIVGNNMESAIRAFDRSDIASGTDVIVYNDQSVPRDPNKRMLFLRGMVEAGFLDPTIPQQREQIFSLLYLRDFRGFMERGQANLRRAERENLAIMAGEPVEVIPDIDDHLQHISVLDELVLSEEYEIKVRQELEESEGTTSPTREAARQHRAEHLAAMQGQPPIGGPAGPAPPPTSGGPVEQPPSSVALPPPEGNPASEMPAMTGDVQ